MAIIYEVQIYAYIPRNPNVFVLERDEGHHADGRYEDQSLALAAVKASLDEPYVDEVRIIKVQS